MTRAALCVLLLSSVQFVDLKCGMAKSKHKDLPNIPYHYRDVGQSVFVVSISRLLYIYIYISSTAPLSPLILLVRTVLLSAQTHTHKHTPILIQKKNHKT